MPGKVKEEIAKLKGKGKTTDTMSLLNNLDVKSSLEQQHQFGIITCDKTSDNFVFIFLKIQPNRTPV